jgi:hypothetical protein
MEEVESRLSQIGRAGSVQVETDPSIPPLPRRSRRMAFLLLAMLVLVTLGIGATLLFGSEDARSKEHGTEGPALRSDGEQPPVKAESVRGITVEILFESEPPGAEILRDGEVLGRTPTQLPFPREERQGLFGFRLKGHATAWRKVSLAASGRMQVALKKRSGQKKKRKRKTGGRGSKDIDLGGTVDPFAE